MIVVERLTPEWSDAFLASRNSLFTKVSKEYVERVHWGKSPFPVHSFIARDDQRVMAWSTFYLRKLDVRGDATSPLRAAMACAIGTLSEYQRQGLGRKVWRLAEEALASEADAIMLYTSEGGKGFPFYRAQGHLPLFYPRPMRMSASGGDRTEQPNVTTRPFAESQALSARRSEIFASCYRGYGGFMVGRPESLDQWGEISFLYDSSTMGCLPQISWLESPDRNLTAYAIWTGPIRKMGWKKDVVEVWELASTDDCDVESLRCLLGPARAAACDGNGQIDWWAAPGHRLAEQMLELGFEERPRSLSVMGKVFDPARFLSHQLQERGASRVPVECNCVANRRLELRLNDCDAEIEVDAATRILFGRSTASLECQHGLLTIRPTHKLRATIELLDRIFPLAKWGYFESEFI